MRKLAKNINNVVDMHFLDRDSSKRAQILDVHCVCKITSMDK